MSNFDVFISFKNSDEEGRPTRERDLAHEIFSSLEARGMNVFWSSISIEKMGKAVFKKAIDEALDTASVLVAVCANPNHVKGWVEYECDSFIIETLSGRKSRGQMCTYLDGLGVGQLPLGFRKHQAFWHGPGSIESLGNFVENSLRGSEAPLGALSSGEPIAEEDATPISGIDWLLSKKDSIRELNARISDRIDLPWSPEISVWFGMIGVAVAEAWTAGHAEIRSDQIRAIVEKPLEHDYGITDKTWEQALRVYYIPAKHGNELNFLLITPKRDTYAINQPLLASNWDGSGMVSAWRTIYPTPANLRQPAEGAERQWCDWLREHFS